MSRLPPLIRRGIFALCISLTVLSAGCAELRNLANIPILMGGSKPTPYAPAAEFVADALAAVPSEVTNESPGNLRKAAAETLREVSAAGGGALPVPPHMIERIDFDRRELLDDFRMENTTLLEHDLELANVLVDRLSVGGLDTGTQEAYLESLKQILLADYLVVTISVADAEHLVRSAHAAREIISDIGLQAAEVEIERTRTSSAALMEAFWKGEVRRALDIFIPAWESSASVRSIWGIDYDGDYDKDENQDLLEFSLGASPFVADSDADGLSDAFEINLTVPFAMPNNADTDDDGVLDGDEDLDLDGVVNSIERDLGSNPLKLDSDGDGMGDIALILGEDMGKTTGDSDGDGLLDESEERLGTNPLHVDSDGDGVPDSQEFHLQVFTDEGLGLVVEIMGMGDHSSTLVIEPMVGAPGFAGNFGQVGNFVRLSTSLPIEYARLRLAYDETLVPAADELNLRLFLYDESVGEMVMLGDPGVDVNGNTVSGTTQKLGPIGVLYLPIWQAVNPQ